MKTNKNAIRPTKQSLIKGIVTPLQILALLFMLSAGVTYAETPPMPAQATININKASPEEIAQSLKGIGVKKAQAIVAWRETHGSFNSLEQLTEVKGVGEATLAKNSQKMTLE